METLIFQNNFMVKNKTAAPESATALFIHIEIRAGFLFLPRFI
jgi:hypothetical protein